MTKDYTYSSLSIRYLTLCAKFNFRADVYCFNFNFNFLFQIVPFLDTVPACKKVMSNSPGLVDVAIELVNSVLNLPAN